ncbi:MAG: polymer-forming cytoskeletal protein [Planctomycetes bacterium]|nr:polymer-forming cytoskeletal protein [Planctomycetota bacterium]
MLSNRLSKKDGSAILAILFIIAIIAGLGIAYITITSGQQRQVQSSIEDIEYNQAVASGFEVSKAFLLAKYTAGTTGWDNELAASIANYSTYTPAASSIIPPSPYTPNYQSWFQWCRNIDYHGNTYFVRLENNNDGGGPANDADNILKVTAEGWGQGNDPQDRSQQIVLEAMVTYRTDPYRPTSAVVVGGSLQISGNAAINGTNGSVQANGPVTLTGSATVAGDVTSTGSISAPGGSIGGSSNPNSEETEIPPINPTQYSYLATHTFKTDGKVYDNLGVQIATPAGWSYSAGTPVSSAALGVWTKTGNDTSTAGVFFFENSAVNISGSPGSAASPWPVTMIATGYIDVSGTPSLKPNAGGGGIALMSGEDLKMRGGGGNLYDVGLYAAHEQISLRGTPTIKGVVLAEDFTDSCSLISTTSQVDVDISGNTEITYNGDLTTVLIDGNPYIKVLGLKKSIKAKY